MSEDDGMTSSANADRSAQKPRKSRRWLVVLLTGSLCVNLLLLGIAGGFWIRADGPRVGAWAGLDRIAVFRMIRSIDDDHRATIEDIMAEHKDALRQSNREMRAARRQLAASLTAEPFDAEQFKADIAQSRLSQVANAAVVDSVLVQIATDVGPEGRAEMAKALRGKRRDHEHRGHDHDERQRRQGDQQDGDK